MQSFHFKPAGSGVDGKQYQKGVSASKRRIATREELFLAGRINYFDVIKTTSVLNLHKKEIVA